MIFEQLADDGPWVLIERRASPRHCGCILCRFAGNVVSVDGGAPRLAGNNTSTSRGWFHGYFRRK